MQPNVVKMTKPFISLCPEITRADAFNLMDWLEDEHVTRYLSDSRHVSRFIEQVVGRVQLPILTHLFNQGGRFFMAYDRDDVPVGFVRLVKMGRDCEMVLVIGNRENWGRKLGASAIREGMKLAFFDMRAEKLIAKIHADNARSRKAFERCGFLLETQTPALHSLAMTSERYLRLLRENPAEHVTHIHITEIDKARLRNMLAFEEPSGIFELEHEIERAIVVGPAGGGERCGDHELQGRGATGRRGHGSGTGLPRRRRRQRRQTLGLLRHGHRHPGLQGRRHFCVAPAEPHPPHPD